jgi:hypothetical protein
MSTLKSLGTAICSLFLFLALSVFGIAFMLNSTLLNPDFVAAQVDKIDVSDLTQEFAEEQIVPEVPEEFDFLVDVIYEVIDEEEPWIREQLHTAIYAGFDFILSKTDALNIYIPLEAKKEELRESFWKAFTDSVPQWLPDLVESELGSYLTRYIDYFASDIPEQYLPPELVSASADVLREYLSDYLTEKALEVVEENPPVVTGLLESVVRPYFDEYYDDIMEQLPSALEVNRSTIDDDAWETLILVRKYVGYFKTSYYLLIAFMALMVIAIFLINRNVRNSTRSLGISLLVYGVLEFAGVYVARNLLPTDISFLFPDSAGIPESLQTWLSGFYTDVLAPLQIFSIIILAIGVVLIVVSILYRRKQEDAFADSDLAD